MDYRGLNNITRKNRYLLPLIKDKWYFKGKILYKIKYYDRIS